MSRCSCWSGISSYRLKIYFCVFVLMFTNSFTITVTYPFLPFMVEFLVPTVTAITLGNYVGILPTSYNAGRFFGSYLWGNVADCIGRKPVIVANCILMALSSGVFGFSVDFPMAVIFRFMSGAANSLPAALKAVLSESSTNKNQALAMGVYATGWGLGLVIGPAVGGALANPVAHYNWTSMLRSESNISNPTSCSSGAFACLVTILQMFPYSLPCVMNALLIIVVMILAIFLLPETLKSKRKRESAKSLANPVQGGNIQESDVGSHTDVVHNEPDSTRSADHHSIDPSVKTCEHPRCTGSCEHPHPCGCTECTTNRELPKEDDERTSLMRTTNTVHQTDGSVAVGSTSYGSINSRVPEEENCTDKEDIVRHSRSKDYCKKLSIAIKTPLKNAWDFFKDPVTRKALLIYCTFSYAFNGLDEVYSLYCKTDPELGGLGFQETEIGLSLAIVGAIMLPIIVWLFPVLERLIGTKKSFLFACIFVMSGSVMIPSLTVVARQGNTKLLWSLLISIMFIIKTAIGVCIACISLFINNSVFFHQLASVNGLALSITCISRTLAPVITSSLWSASLTENSRRIGFPFDYHLIFILCGIVYLSCIIIVAMLPKSIDKQKKIPSRST